MTQYARPDSGTGFEDISEVTPDDGDFVSIELDNGGFGGELGSLEFGLSDIDEPETRDDHALAFRAAWSRDDPFEPISLEIRGIIKEGATTIKTGDWELLTEDVFDDFSVTLTNGEASGITDYSDLSVVFEGRLTAAEPPPPMNHIVKVSWAEFAAPDAAEPPGPIPTTIEVTPALASIFEDDTVQLTAVVRDELGDVIPDAVVTWESDDENIATVDVNGLVTGVLEGSAIITGTIDALSDTSDITVLALPAPTTLVVTPPTASEKEGRTVQLTAVVYDQYDDPMPDEDVTWESDDEDIATVDVDGLVLCRRTGEAVITASSNPSDTAVITVLPLYVCVGDPTTSYDCIADPTPPSYACVTEPYPLQP